MHWVNVVLSDRSSWEDLIQSLRVQWQDWPQKQHSSHEAEVLVVKPNEKMYTLAFENIYLSYKYKIYFKV